MQALILVDLQNDFLPGGALAVPHGDEVIAVANELQEKFDLVVTTQDWHPVDHGSFAANHPGRHVGDTIELDGRAQILWPVHCVQNTPGAAFAETLELAAPAHIFQKGTNPRIDSYSGFFDNGHQQSTGLAEFLRERSIEQVSIMGLATDYCVKFTALDARQLGFPTTLLLAGCRGVNLQPGDVDQAVEEMREAGVVIR